MSGKLPIDRVREAKKSPRVLEEHTERLTTQEAALRDAEDPVSGARPTAPEASDAADGEADEGGEGEDA